VNLEIVDDKKYSEDGFHRTVKYMRKFFLRICDLGEVHCSRARSVSIISESNVWPTDIMNHTDSALTYEFQKDFPEAAY